MIAARSSSTSPAGRKPGTLGLIAAVPITTALAALAARERDEPDATPPGTDQLSALAREEPDAAW